MPTTRSRNKQARLEDLPSVKTETKKSTASSKQSPKTATGSSKKRATPDSSAQSKGKRVKKENSEEDQGEHGSNRTVLINRSPVLHLYAACVAEVLDPSLPWSTCLSAGSAISTLCAVAKGRSIGVIDKPKEHDKSKEKKPEKEHHFQLMGFKLSLKNGLAEVGGKPKPGSDDHLQKKFGENYDSVLETFRKSLKSWKGDGGSLNSEAFGFYEQFRPTVVHGQSGWGKKGKLDLDNVESVVTKGSR